MDFNKSKINDNKINVNFTKDDMVKCECGCETFINCSTLLIKKSPIIAEQPYVAQVPTKMKCSDCGEYLDISSLHLK